MLSKTLQLALAAATWSTLLAGSATAQTATWEVDIQIDTAQYYDALQFFVWYPTALGEWDGEGLDVACVPKVAALGAWHHEPSATSVGNSTIQASFASTTAFRGPKVLMTCDLTTTTPAPPLGPTFRFLRVEHSPSALSPPVYSVSAVRPK